MFVNLFDLRSSLIKKTKYIRYLEEIWNLQFYY